MPTQAEMNRTLVALALLEEIRHTGKTTSKKGKQIAIAHGEVYDPHVDGRLRLTPVGRARLTQQTLA